MSNELRETIHENIRKLEEKIDKHEKLLNSQTLIFRLILTHLVKICIEL